MRPAAIARHKGPHTCLGVSLIVPRSLLGWTDLLVPKDPGTTRIASGVPYGPLPRHRLDIYAPRNPVRPPPVMLFLYGGGWYSGLRTEYSFAGHAFASLGFLTLVPDYRLVPEVIFPTFVEDCALAAGWAIANAASYGGDASEVDFGGHSAGAYNAVMLALEPARFGCPELAPRLLGVVGLSGPYDFHPFDVWESIDAFGKSEGDPRLSQPINLVHPGSPAMFLAHGERDKVVYPQHSRTLAAALRANGVPVTERYYPSYGHADPLLNLMWPLHWRDGMFADIAGFFSAIRAA